MHGRSIGSATRTLEGASQSPITTFSSVRNATAVAGSQNRISSWASSVKAAWPRRCRRRRPTHPDWPSRFQQPRRTFPRIRAQQRIMRRVRSPASPTTLLGQPHGVRATLARRRTGDQRDLSLYAAHRLAGLPSRGPLRLRLPVIGDVRGPQGTAISTLLLRVNALRTGQLNVAGIVCPADGSGTRAGR
jgi:hypothetical protein